MRPASATARERTGIHHTTTAARRNLALVWPVYQVLYWNCDETDHTGLKKFVYTVRVLSRRARGEVCNHFRA